MKPDVIWAIAAIAVIVIMAAFFAGLWLGRRLESKDHVERGRQERLFRAGQLRERGRIHDVREDATGAPASVHPVRVLGASPRHRPPTRM